VADCVLHVFVEDAVLASAIGDLHHDKVALSDPRVKVTLSASLSAYADDGAGGDISALDGMPGCDGFAP
jgi:hypothetical protein